MDYNSQKARENSNKEFKDAIDMKNMKLNRTVSWNEWKDARWYNEKKSRFLSKHYARNLTELKFWK